MTGNDYHNQSKYYGAYPPNYLKRLKLLFPNQNKVLHLFSGMTPKGTWNNEISLDIKEELKPDIIGDATFLSNYKEELKETDLILSDPPYLNNHIKYDTEKVHKVKVIKECAKILEKDGCLVWLDTIMPIWAKKDGWKIRGTIALLQSTNHQVRVITILEKTI